MYRAVCTCGYKGRKLRDPNSADEHAENHASKYDQYQGGRPDGRRHSTEVVEVEN